MTHPEIQELLAGYALNALDVSEEAIVAEHLESCSACQAEYADLAATVATVAASTSQAPPARLRTRVLASAEEAFSATPIQPRRRRPMLQLRRFEWLAAAVLVVALAGTVGYQARGNRQAQSDLGRDQAALVLLTSTETTNDQLVQGNLAGLPAEAHGHWFHRQGVMTQVIVGEFLPQPPAGRHYEAWLLGPNGWSDAGRMDIDSTGYGRVILLGSDGTAVRSVEVTLEQGAASQPGSTVALRFP